MCREPKSSCWAENSWLSFKKEEEKKVRYRLKSDNPGFWGNYWKLYAIDDMTIFVS